MAIPLSYNLRNLMVRRLSTLSALNRANQQYRSQVLVLSAAASRSTMMQYEVGRVPFAAVLEALSGYIADRSSYLGSVADAQLLAIAQEEVSLDPVPSLSAGASGSMPGVSATAGRMSADAPPSAGADAPSRATGGM